MHGQYDGQTYGYLPSCTALPPLDRYQFIHLYSLVTKARVCVNNLPKVVTWKRNDWELNPRPLESHIQCSNATVFVCTSLKYGNFTYSPLLHSGFSFACVPYKVAGMLRFIKKSGSKLFQILSNFPPKKFTGRFLAKFAVKSLLNSPRHFAYVASLPCDTIMSENKRLMINYKVV